MPPPRRSAKRWPSPCRIRWVSATRCIGIPITRDTPRARNSLRSGAGCSSASALFDERLVRNQDDEFNYRIRLAGGKVYVSPRVQVHIFRARPHRPAVQAVLSVRLLAYSGDRKTRAPDHAAADGADAVLRGLCRCSPWRACGGGAGLALILPGRDLLGALLLAGAARIPRRRSPRRRLRAPSLSRRCMPATRWGFGYGMWARLFHAGAWDAQGKMAAISR